MFVDPLDAAWAAGFLDGEGYFGIAKRDGSPVIEAAQVATRAPLDRLAALLGGSVSRGRRCWRWRLSSAPATRRAVSMLLPHLSVKAEQAEALVAYACTFRERGARPLTAEHLLLRAALAERLSIARTTSCR